MRLSATLSLLALLTGVEALSQVVNIEQARVNLDSTGWQANVDLSYFRQEFDDDLTTVTGRFSAQKKDSKIYLLLLADAGYSYSQEDVFTNYKLGHVRASVKCAPRIRWEAFVQAQDNRPLGIQFRSLLGTGPRARLFANEHGRLYGGTTAMLENEWSTKTPLLSLSLYLSISLSLYLSISLSQSQSQSQSQSLSLSLSQTYVLLITPLQTV